MSRKNHVIVGFVVVAFAALVGGQSPAIPHVRDFTEFCREYGRAELVFVGRVHREVILRISGEAEIEKALQNLIRTKAEVERLRASLDLKTRLERNAEFEIRIIEAQTEFDMRRNMYPLPFELTLIPVDVDRVFRGVAGASLLLRRDRSLTLEAGELYLISGRRRNDLLAGYPSRPDLAALEFVDTASVTPVASAQHELQFLAATTSGTTIIGHLRMHSYSDLIGAPLSGVRIIVSSGTDVLETTTREDGSFAVTGIQSDRVEIRPLLPEGLIVANKSALTVDVREGGCAAAFLTAAPNGRVRGRVFSATGTSLDGVELVLDGGIAPSGRDVMYSSHAPRSSTRPNDDGTFEFSGVFPGSYFLFARLEKSTDGKKRYFTTYFPGTPDLASAQPVIVGKATAHNGFDFLVTTE